MGMKLLVTGGSGFLGRRTAAYFEELGWQVLAPSHEALDITDETGVFRYFRENRPDAVIHTAAVSDTGLCQRDPAWSEKINVDGCGNLAKIAGVCMLTRLSVHCADRMTAMSRWNGVS